MAQDWWSRLVYGNRRHIQDPKLIGTGATSNFTNVLRQAQAAEDRGADPTLYNRMQMEIPGQVASDINRSRQIMAESQGGIGTGASGGARARIAGSISDRIARVEELARNRNRNRFMDADRATREGARRDVASAETRLGQAEFQRQGMNTQIQNQRDMQEEILQQQQDAANQQKMMGLANMGIQTGLGAATLGSSIAAQQAANAANTVTREAVNAAAPIASVAPAVASRAMVPQAMNMPETTLQAAPPNQYNFDPVTLQEGQFPTMNMPEVTLQGGQYAPPPQPGISYTPQAFQINPQVAQGWAQNYSDEALIQMLASGSITREQFLGMQGGM